MKITNLLFWTGLALMILVGVMAVSQSHAAQTPVGTITTPSTGQTTLKAYNDSYINPKLTIIGGNFDDIAANKADKAQSIRYWADHANGTTLAVGTIVAYEGKLYNTTQEFLKTAGATPTGFSAYFSEVAGGSGGTTYTAGTGITITEGVIASTVTDTDTFASWDKDYNDLINAPTGGSMTWPSSAGIMVYGGSSAFGTSLVADGDAIGEVVVVQDDGEGNPELPFTIDISSLTDTTAILTGKLSISSIDDAPVDSETAAPISSNYMYDHVNGADPHTGYVLESSVISGTVELNTTTVANSGVIASGSSQLLATHATATGAATTDSCEWGFVGDPVAKTGFIPSANGMLSVWCYVDATGYVQVRTSNNTASSITLNTAGNGATIKWMVRK